MRFFLVRNALQFGVFPPHGKAASRHCSTKLLMLTKQVSISLRCITMLLGLALGLAFSACSGGGSADLTAAPSDSGPTSTPPGPALQVSQEQLEDALACTPNLAQATRDPVLLTPAFSTDEESFGWNYLPQLQSLGIPLCSLSIPDGGFGDLQNAAEYVVLAVRQMAAISERSIILFGHQHGPLDELWALMFWPDIPQQVSSLISLATPYQGTTSAQNTCALSGSCPPSVWQIAQGSNFLAALNARPLPTGPAYTSIATQFDEFITPQPQASRREGATNILLQDICPGRLVEHFSILADNVVYELVLDAINNPGSPANPNNLPDGICAGPLFMPATNSPESSVAALQGLTGFLTGFGEAIATESVDAEPALRDYALTE